MIKIPDDLFEGTSCLTNEIPWMTEGSILKMDEILNSRDVVLEIGSGGSTLFFARRCKSVISIETNHEWYDNVRTKIDSENILNVSYSFMPSEEDICFMLERVSPNTVTVFSVDTQGGDYNRSKILNAFLSKGIPTSLRMIVLDNYAHEGLFPLHFDKKIIDSPDWEEITYKHDRWAGEGTKLIIKKQ